MHVALTRAEEELYLTCAETRTMLGRTAANPVSRFVREIPEELVGRGQRLAAPDRATSAASHRIEGLAPGQKVRHPRFGWGTIVAMRGSGDDTEVTIAFPGGGVRSFLAKFAQLIGEDAEFGGA